MSNLAFGAPQHHYSTKKAGSQSPDLRAPLRHRLIAEIEGFLGEDAQSEVERALAAWGRRVREALGAETGLALTRKRKSVAVSVRAVPGLPPPFNPVLDAVPDPMTWWIALNKTALRTSAGTLLDLDKRLDQFAGSPTLSGIDSKVVKPGLAVSEALITKLLDTEATKGLKELLKQFTHDTLGAYFFDEHRIDVYFSAVGIFARLAEVGVEDLAIVVLAHELAHAYTHVGFDIDGRQWETGRFAESPLGTIEGLAQFYTHRVCQRLATHRPSVENAFSALLGFQSGPYLVHNEWLKLGNRIGEAVRQTLIDFRLRPNAHPYDDFSNALQKAHGAMVAASRTSAPTAVRDDGAAS